MKRSDLADKHCSIARASAQIVDSWTFIILRELFLGNRRFAGMQKKTGMSPRSLTLRLRKLEEEGILSRPAATGDKDYALTEKGHALWPALIMLKQWGDDWCHPDSDEDLPLINMHRGTGHEMRAKLVCEVCGEPVSTHTTKSILSDRFQSERGGVDAT